MEEAPTPAGPRNERPRLVVGIGASAGGLDPLVRFFDRVPEDTGMAFVIVQHLSPDFRSLMDELLARHTMLPIHLVEDGMPVEPNHVYLIPPKKQMIISGGRLLLSERERQQELTLPIDMFFRSLAQDCGAMAVAIVMSGGGSDGSRGIRHVHDAGGLVLAQDLESAQFDGMPRAAIETGVVDRTLPPQDMPDVLAERATRHADGGPAAPRQARREPTGLDAVYRLLEAEYGIDFNHYKPSTVTRRIERRLALAQSSNIDEYLARLHSEREELDALYRDLLIGVTRFFRDTDAFELLERQILPELLTREPRSAPLRLWVAGCATGEEAYSLAILLQDLMAVHGERPVKIFATDVHRGSLDQAALAAYGEDAVSNVSPERLARYFTQVGHSYQVVPELRQMIVFAQHNVITDAPFTRLDLVTCRNLLIYLQPPAQQRVLAHFHFSLTHSGVLMLGPSETLGPLADGFEILDKHWQLYRKGGEVRTPVGRHQHPAASLDPRLAPPPVAPARHSLGQLLSVYDALLEETMPPSLIVNERGELVHVLGGAARFLRARDGRQSLDVLDQVHTELKMILSGGIKRALAERSSVVFNGVRAHADNQIYRVTIRAIAGRGPGRHVVVSFEAAGAAGRPAPSAPIQIDLDRVSQQQFAALEAELGTTKDSLQAAIEQLEASNEELQASNEELQASNEELQSTNEELQSVNEELYTVNAEYQRKIAELTELTNDMDNLLASTDVGTVFLDGQLRIRKFTPQIAEAFGLVAHDVGRSIETFAHKMRYPELVDDLKRVLASGRRIERDGAELNGKSFFLRLLPYRAKGVADGVVLTLIDVSGLKAAEDALFHERYLLNSLLRSVPDAIYFKDTRGRFIRFNHAMAARLGVADPAEVIGRTAFDLPDQTAAMALHREDEAVLRSGQPQHYRLEPRMTADGAEAWDMVTRLPLVDRDNATIVGVIAIFRDVTEQVRAKAKIDEEVKRRDQFLAMLSHELRNPLGAVVTATAMLKGAEAPSGVGERAVSVLERQSRQMARLLDDLLEVSRVTQNKIELRRRVVDLRLVAAEAADAVRPPMDDKGLDFVIDLDPEPIWVYGDSARLQQIQINLLGNAIKYTPRGGRVTLRAHREANGGVIRVVDDGVGISPQMLESVFDLFVQARHTRDRSNGGLGVGLTLVRALVEMHGGTVSAHSDGDGAGSEFAVRLPLATPAAFPSGQEPVALSALSSGTTVVVVEDNADSRDMLCTILTHAGLNCYGAPDGTTGLQLIDEVSPEIVILDVGLPEIDGLEVARRVRASARHRGVRLIALTGYGQSRDRVATKEAGFDYHLVKPVQPGELLGLIAQLQTSEASPDAGPVSELQ